MNKRNDWTNIVLSIGILLHHDLMNAHPIPPNLMGHVKLYDEDKQYVTIGDTKDTMKMSFLGAGPLTYLLHNFTKDELEQIPGKTIDFYTNALEFATTKGNIWPVAGTAIRGFSIEEAFHNIDCSEVFGWNLTPLTMENIESLFVQYSEEIPLLNILSPTSGTILLVKTYDFDHERVQGVNSCLLDILVEIERILSLSDTHHELGESIRNLRKLAEEEENM